jgi:hypothetical protein
VPWRRSAGFPPAGPSAAKTPLFGWIEEPIMTWDHRIAKVAPYVAVGIAMLVTFMTFSAYFH